MDKKRTAVVILNWNGAQMMRQFLPRVVEYSREEADIYVADNASTDDSIALLEREFPEVRILRFDKNWGFAGGYNRALTEIDAEYYLLLNSDVEVTDHWLTPLVALMDRRSDVAACQPKLLSERDHGSFEYAGACGGYLDRYGYPFCRGRVFDVVERDCGQYDTDADVLWATGACLMVRAADFHAVGGFDDRFFAHCEEIDLCWRLALKGRKVSCVTASKVYHVGGGTLPKGNPMKTYLNFRNNLIMLYKNLPDRELKHVMRVRGLLDYVAAVKFLLCGQTGDFKAVVRARRDFRRRCPEYVAVRRALQQERCTVQETGRFRWSLLWRYYVKGRKTFSELLR